MTKDFWYGVTLVLCASAGSLCVLQARKCRQADSPVVEQSAPSLVGFLEIPEGRMTEIETKLQALEERVGNLEKDVNRHSESVKSFDESFSTDSELWRKHEQRHAALDELVNRLTQERRTTSALVPASEIADEFKDAPAIPREVTSR